MDASVARLVDAYADNVVARDHSAHAQETQPEVVDVDALFEALENEDDGNLRDRRLAQLQRELNTINSLKGKEHGQYIEIKEEKLVFEITTSTPKVIVHFFHEDFRRCQIMDSHLESLAENHFQTKFVKINVENCPFVVVSLKVQVLPCIIAFIDGIAADRIVGFDDLGNTDNFSTAQLEFRLYKSGVISRPRLAESKSTSILEFTSKKTNAESDQDSDYD